MSLGAIAFALLLLMPLAAAHIDDPPPRLQPFQHPRVPQVEADGTRLVVDMIRATDPRAQNDPLRDLIRYRLDPAQAKLHAEYRSSPSDAGSAFWMSVEPKRVIEYRDVNEDHRFDPNIDLVVHQWPLSEGRWNITGVADAHVGRVPVKTATWMTALATGPELSVQVAIGGSAPMLDEGAMAMPQDMMLYLDMDRLPPRGTGHLFAIDGTVSVQPGTDLGIQRKDNATTALVATAQDRVAFFQWGGEGRVDGKEQPIHGSLSEARTADDGSIARDFRLHLPIADREAHMVVVFGLDYAEPLARTPGAPLPLVLVLVALGAFLVARRR